MLNKLDTSIYCSNEGFVYQHGGENGCACDMHKVDGIHLSDNSRMEGRKLGRKPRVNILTAKHSFFPLLSHTVYGKQVVRKTLPEACQVPPCLRIKYITSYYVSLLQSREVRHNLASQKCEALHGNLFFHFRVSEVKCAGIFGSFRCITATFWSGVLAQPVRVIKFKISLKDEWISRYLV